MFSPVGLILAVLAGFVAWIVTASVLVGVVVAVIVLLLVGVGYPYVTRDRV